MRDDGIHVDVSAADRPAGNLIAKVFFGIFCAQLTEQVAKRGESPERRAERVSVPVELNALIHAVNHETELRRDRPRLQIGVHDHGRGNGIRDFKCLPNARGVGVIPTTVKYVAEITFCLRLNRLVRLVLFPDGGVLSDRDRPEQFAVEPDEVDGDLLLIILRRDFEIGSHVIDGRKIAAAASRNDPAEEVPAACYLDCGGKEFKRFGSARPVQNACKRKLLRRGKIAFPIEARIVKFRLHSGIDRFVGIGVISERNRNYVCRSLVARVNRLRTHTQSVALNDEVLGDRGITLRRIYDGVPAVECSARALRKRRLHREPVRAEQEGKRIVPVAVIRYGDKISARFVLPQSVIGISVIGIFFNRAAARVEIERNVVARPLRFQHNVADGTADNARENISDHVMFFVDTVKVFRCRLAVQRDEFPPVERVTLLLRFCKRERIGNGVAILCAVQRCIHAVNEFIGSKSAIGNCIGLRFPYGSEVELLIDDRIEENRFHSGLAAVKLNLRSPAARRNYPIAVYRLVVVKPAAERISAAGHIFSDRELRFCACVENAERRVVLAHEGRAAAGKLFIDKGIGDRLPACVHRLIGSGNAAEGERLAARRV